MASIVYHAFQRNAIKQRIALKAERDINDTAVVSHGNRSVQAENRCQRSVKSEAEALRSQACVLQWQTSKPLKKAYTTI